MRKLFLSASLLSLLALPGLVSAEEKPSIPNEFATVGTSTDQPSECAGVAGNLVQNCGFETGSLSSWSFSGDTSFSDVIMGPPVAHSGQFGFRTGPTDDYGLLCQGLVTPPGTTCTLKFWLQNQQRPNRFVVFWNGEIISAGFDLDDFLYTQFTYTGLAANPTGITNVTFGVFNVPWYFYLDDISVVCN